MMNLGIAGRWALVCGASRGLGFGCAQALLRAGVNVVIVARGAEALSAAREQLLADAAVPPDVQVEMVAADITTAQGRGEALARRPYYDIVVTNAGGPPPGDFRDWTREDWVAALDANMLAPIALIKATVDSMVARRYGRIVNITSTAVKAPLDVLGLSNGARSGLTGFVAGLARKPELASANVTINNLLPGFFATPRVVEFLQASAHAVDSTEEAAREARLAAIPARRLGDPAEFGATCAFLCSTHAGYITGQNILLDGGAYPGTF